MHQDEEQQTDDGQTFQRHGQHGRPFARNEHDEVDGHRFEERHQFRAHTLQLKMEKVQHLNQEHTKTRNGVAEKF